MTKEPKNADMHEKYLIEKREQDKIRQELEREMNIAL